MAPALIHDPSAAYARAVRLRVRTPSTSVPCVVDINHRAIRQGAPFVEISSDTLGNLRRHLPHTDIYISFSVAVAVGDHSGRMCGSSWRLVRIAEVDDRLENE